MNLRITQISLPVFVGLLTFLVFIGLDAIEGDTYWHIKAGEWMFSNREIPRHDIFSYTKNGASWINLEWLAQLILYGSYASWGWTGVRVMAALALAITIASIARILLSRQCSPYLVIVSAIMAAGICYTHYWARPHVLAWAPLVFWAAWQADAGEKGSPPPWWTIILMILWANLHGSFTLGMGLAVVGAAEAMETVWRREKRIFPIKSWLSYLTAVFLAGMATPYGAASMLMTPQSLSMDVSLAYIAEWKSPTFHGLHPFELWLLVIIAAASMKRLNLSWVRWLLLFFLIDAGLRYQRNAVLFGLLVPVYLGKALDTTWISAYGSSVNRFLARWPQRTSIAAWSLAMAIAVGAGISATPSQNKSIASAAAAMTAVRDWSGGQEPGHVFNDYGLGGYLIYEGVKPFIDGRTLIYGDDFLAHHLDAEMLHSSSALTDILASYGVRWTFLLAHAPAAALMDHLHGWRRLYVDDEIAVHIRDTLPASASH